MAKTIYRGRLQTKKSTYRGDCALKKRAREWDIDTALGVAGNSFRSKKYLVLAGREGRDIQELLDWGVPAKNIWACERCGPDFKAVTKRFSATAVNFLGCELKDIPEEYGGICGNLVRHGRQQTMVSDKQCTIASYWSGACRHGYGTDGQPHSSPF